MRKRSIMHPITLSSRQGSSTPLQHRRGRGREGQREREREIENYASHAYKAL